MMQKVTLIKVGKKWWPCTKQSAVVASVDCVVVVMTVVVVTVECGVGRYDARDGH